MKPRHWILSAALVLMAAEPLSAHKSQPKPDPDYYDHSISVTAAAMQVDAALVSSVRALGLPEQLQWVVLRLCKRSGKSAAGIQRLRETRHWGEVAEACGSSWPQVLAEVGRLAEAAQLSPNPGSAEQLLRASTNKPAEGGR